MLEVHDELEMHQLTRGDRESKSDEYFYIIKALSEFFLSYCVRRNIVDKYEFLHIYSHTGILMIRRLCNGNSNANI